MSKIIGKSDDSAKEFIIKTLDGDKTYGFDFDSIYYSQGRWNIIEFLKCENQYMTPHTSDPKHYPWNWKKFYSLYQAANALDGVLWLVNYSDREHDKDEVRLMKVESLDYDKIDEYNKTLFNYRPKKMEYMKFSEDYKMTFYEFQEWFKNLNRNAQLPPMKLK